MPGLSGLNQRHLRLLIRLFERRPPIRIPHPFDQPLCRLERLPDLANPLDEGAGVSRASRPGRHPVPTVAGGALALEAGGRQQVSTDRSVAGGTGRHPPVAVLEQREVLAALEVDVRPGVTRPTGRWQLRPVDRARRVEATQHTPMRLERLERRRVSIVTLLATDIVAAVRRPAPFIQMRLRRLGVGIREMTVGAAALRVLRQCG